MTSRTSGGLIKRSVTFEEKQLRRMEKFASDRKTSTSAVMRSLIDLGFRVEDLRTELTQPTEDLAVKVVAKESDAA